MYDIHTMSQDLKIGALVIPMASSDQFDALQATLADKQVSNFALLGTLPDQVTYGGSVVPIGNAIHGVEQAAFVAQGVWTRAFLDEEGGTVQRTKKLTGAPVLPSAQQQATIESGALTDLVGSLAAYDAALGINAIFGPVIDVGTQGADGSRSFSDSPAKMAEVAGTVIDGWRKSGMAVTIKHFPDYGSAPSNSDEGSVTLGKNLDQLKASSLPYVQQVIENKQPEYVMTTNAIVPGLSDPAPASLVPATYYLGKVDMGSEAAFITDALNAKSIEVHTGLTGIASEQQASQEAIAAGADGVIISLEATGVVVDGLAAAVTNGAIPQVRIDDAAANMLEARGYGICR
jgi:beta-N-acetylhexosaminidase